MYSLFYVLANQHTDEFAPVRCNEQTFARLLRYFEDVVTENKLSALVIEGGRLESQASRDGDRLARLVASARHLYFFSSKPGCEAKARSLEHAANLTILEEDPQQQIESGPFILIMDPRFCGLLASFEIKAEDNEHPPMYEIIWTFDPNVVFTAIEYLMARISTQAPAERARFAAVLNASTPHNISLRTALTLTTKLTLLMQRQNELEMAMNRLSSAISSTLDLEALLQTAVEEVGRTLNARRTALVLWQEGTSRPENMSVYERPENDSTESQGQTPFARNGDSPLRGRGQPAPVANAEMIPGLLEIPITYRSSVIGVLEVEDDTAGRAWEDEEVLMVKTVSDQLAVAICHARLFRQVQTQAMTDPLTGLYNQRYFQERLDREIKLADRNDNHVSLILLDLDRLKRINDTYGHRAGDAALCHVAELMRKVVREVDVCARYGGEEFVIILPQCSREDSIAVAERLREAIASSPLHRIGQVTASIGVACYPALAKTKEELIEMADRAMYLAKAAGRNRVRTLMRRTLNGVTL
ncbi:MAG TPA: sensor domain-containing diguanylate cyclase [Blastocatellia bacterium]|nr:sensor domain-containing diguanylate cyclase [Blastocatellia bacterium]